MLKHVVNNIKIKGRFNSYLFIAPKVQDLLTAQQRYDYLQQISHLYPGSNKGIDYECQIMKLNKKNLFIQLILLT